MNMRIYKILNKHVDMFGYTYISMYSKVCFRFAVWCYFEFIFDSNSLRILFYITLVNCIFANLVPGRRISENIILYQFLSIFPQGNNENLAWTRAIFHDNSGWVFSNLAFVGGDILVGFTVLTNNTKFSRKYIDYFCRFSEWFLNSIAVTTYIEVQIVYM